MQVFLKFIISTFLFISIPFCKVNAQDTAAIAISIQQYNITENTEKKIEIAFNIVDKYIKIDLDDSAQIWVYKLIELNSKKTIDTTNYFIYSRQTEIFYYSNLMQFGLAAANKSIDIAQKLNDSILIADGLAFKGYIYEALDSFESSKNATYAAKLIFPKNPKPHKWSLIHYTQIVNQLGQIYLKLNNVDSAYLYNSVAYNLILNSSEKGINQRAKNMCLRTFGDIFVQKNNKDSALHYYKLCYVQCLINYYFDIILLNIGKNIVLEKNKPELCFQLLEKALKLADSAKVSAYFQKIFLKDVIDIFKNQNNIKALAILQERIIKNTSDVSDNGNKQIQAISDKYVESENALLRSSISELQSKRLLSKFQIALLSFGVLAAILLLYFLYRSKKIAYLRIIHEQEAVQNERNRIARDMHDDLGSGLTRINYITQKAIANQPTTDDLNTIKNISTAMVENMKEIIWTLKEDNNIINELIYYIKEYTTTYCLENNLNLICNIDEIKNSFKVKGQTRRHIFLSVKEVFHNIVKHSKAKNISLIILFTPQNWVIEIIDDGIGFNTAHTKNSSYGISNISKRIDTVDGSVSWDTTSGTKVIIKLPNNL